MYTDGFPKHFRSRQNDQRQFKQYRTCIQQFYLFIYLFKEKGLRQGAQLKLDHYGINGDTFKWVLSFHSIHSQQVLVEVYTSEAALVSDLWCPPRNNHWTSDVLAQRTLINDLSENVSSTTRVFADIQLLVQENPHIAGCYSTPR